MGLEDHLLRLAGISSHERHPAVAEADVGDLHRRGHPVDQDDLVAPVELVGFAGLETQRDICRRRRLALRPRPDGRIPAHGVIATVVAKGPEILEDANAVRRSRFGFRAFRQHPVEFSAPGAELRLRLDAALVGELRRAGSHHFPTGLSRDTQLPADLLDRLPLLKICPTDFAIVSTTSIPNTAPDCLWNTMDHRIKGVPFGSRSPR